MNDYDRKIIKRIKNGEHISEYDLINLNLTEVTNEIIRLGKEISEKNEELQNMVDADYTDGEGYDSNEFKARAKYVTKLHIERENLESTEQNWFVIKARRFLHTDKSSSASRRASSPIHSSRARSRSRDRNTTRGGKKRTTKTLSRKTKRRV